MMMDYMGEVSVWKETREEGLSDNRRKEYLWRFYG